VPAGAGRLDPRIPIANAAPHSAGSAARRRAVLTDRAGKLA
jgi:hypothetical protein